MLYNKKYRKANSDWQLTWNLGIFIVSDIGNMVISENVVRQKGSSYFKNHKHIEKQRCHTSKLNFFRNISFGTVNEWKDKWERSFSNIAVQFGKMEIIHVDQYTLQLTSTKLLMRHISM